MVVILPSGAQSSFRLPETIRALSVGVRVSPMVIVRAPAESLNLMDGESLRLAELLPKSVNDLTDAQTAALLHLVQEMIHKYPPNEGTAPLPNVGPDTGKRG